MKYLLPKELGGGEYEADDWESPWGSYLVRFTIPGLAQPVMLDMRNLTEVKPTQPEEPGPGAYLIGEVLFSCMDTDAIDLRWIPALADGEPSVALTWGMVWQQYGGPDVTIRPLRPAPEPVELPWRQNFNDGDPLIVDRSSASNRDVYVSGFAHLAAEDARSFAYAILTAAGDQ